MSRLIFQIWDETLGDAGGDVFASVGVFVFASHFVVWAVADGTVFGEGDGVDGVGGDIDVVGLSVWGLGFDVAVFAELDDGEWGIGFRLGAGDEVGGGDSFGGAVGVLSGGVDGEVFGFLAGAL